jgi:hypothetical protein
VTVSHAYPDYRNHLHFTARMTRFLKALLGKTVQFTFPRLWHTKGEILREFAALPEGDSRRDTKSCWRNSRWSALNGKLVQCGICAACMLRRMSAHAAGLDEEAGTYICTDLRLSASSFADAIHPDFTPTAQHSRNTRLQERFISITWLTWRVTMPVLPSSAMPF